MSSGAGEWPTGAPATAATPASAGASAAASNAIAPLSDLEVLSIERACERLVYEFFEAIDVRNEAHLDNLFSQDATYTRPIDPDTIIGPRDVIRKTFEARPAGRVTRHLCSNVRITLDSADRAHGICRVVLFVGPTDAPAHPQFGFKTDGRQLIGEFADEFIKTPQGWRFSSRRGKVLLHT